MTQDTIKQRLRAARALIDTPWRWTQGALERGTNGPFFEEVARCACGAIREVCLATEANYVNIYLMRSINRHHGRHLGGMPSWNDAPNRTHAEVMQAFDRAITEVVA